MRRYPDYYDFLDARGKSELARAYLDGPENRPESMSPYATKKERETFAALQYRRRFLSNDRCPMGHYPPDFVDPPIIRDRLVSDGYLDHTS